MQWTKTFDLTVSIDQAWDAFMDRATPAPWNHVFTGDPYFGNGAIEVEETERVESDEERRLVWIEREGVDVVEMTVTFTAGESGARITLTRAGFGSSSTLENRVGGRFLGWVESMHDFALFLERGMRAVRHTPSGRGFRKLALLGLDIRESALGVVAGDVRAGLGREAGVQPGDLLLTVNGAPIFSRADAWLFQRLLQPGQEVELTYLRGRETRSGRASVPAT